MARIIDLPPLPSISGLESVAADVAAGTSRFTTQQMVDKAAALYDIPIYWTFTQALLAAGFTIYKDYLFGTAALASLPSQIAIPDIPTLQGFFDAQPTAVGTAVQNEEVERFTNFAPANFVFTASSLNLTAALEPGGAWDVVQKTLIGAVTNANVLTFADTSNVVDGMVVGSSGSSTIATGKRVISHDATTVTLDNFSTVTLPNNAAVEFLPVYAVSANASTNSATVVCPGGYPTGLIPGMFYTNITGGTFGIRRIQQLVDSTHILLDGTVSIGAGNAVLFQPPVTSGQIWTKETFQPGQTSTGVAFELTCTVPQSAASQNGAQRGAWPAFWLYSKPANGSTFDASEIDIFEFFNSLTAGSNAYTSNIHGGAYNVTRYQRSVGSSSNKWDSSGFYRGGVDYGAAQHKFQCIWMQNRVYRFIDDQALVSNDYLWSSQSQAQLGLDLACGSYLSAFMGIFFYPRATAQFPMNYSVNEIKIWTF